MQEWVNYKASITERLKALSGDASLFVLNHTWEKADAWDIHTLRITTNSEVLHRDILMYSHQKPCWYARTILPKSTYNFEYERFKQLGSKTLGELIYNDPQVKRHINPCKIQPEMLEHQYLQNALKQHTPQEDLWGRLSTFIIRDAVTFYLLEIFLPELLKYCPANDPN